MNINFMSSHPTFRTMFSKTSSQGRIVFKSCLSATSSFDAEVKVVFKHCEERLEFSSSFVHHCVYFQRYSPLYYAKYSMVFSCSLRSVVRRSSSVVQAKVGVTSLGKESLLTINKNFTGVQEFVAIVCLLKKEESNVTILNNPLKHTDLTGNAFKTSCLVNKKLLMSSRVERI